LSAALTAKILQALTHAEILTSEQGTKGGYRLNRDLRAVSYLEVQTAILGNDMDEPGRHERCDLYDRCVVLAPVDNLERRVRQLLATTTVAELFAGEPDDCCQVGGGLASNQPESSLAEDTEERFRRSLATKEQQ
jgi:DNA-binding IscR family transcriptional regulator